MASSTPCKGKARARRHAGLALRPTSCGTFGMSPKLSESQIFWSATKDHFWGFVPYVATAALDTGTTLTLRCLPSSTEFSNPLVLAPIPQWPLYMSLSSGTHLEYQCPPALVPLPVSHAGQSSSRPSSHHHGICQSLPLAPTFLRVLEQVFPTAYRSAYFYLDIPRSAQIHYV